MININTKINQSNKSINCNYHINKSIDVCLSSLVMFDLFLDYENHLEKSKNIFFLLLTTESRFVCTTNFSPIFSKQLFLF